MANYVKKQVGLKYIKQAIHLEEQSDDKAAYIKYLQGLSSLSTALLDDAVGNNFLESEDRQKIVTFALESLNRISSLLDKQSFNFNEQFLTIAQSNIITEKISPSNGRISPVNGRVSPSSCVTVNGRLTPSNATVNGRLSPSSFTVIPPAITLSVSAPKPPSPMDQVKSENNRLSSLYFSRMKKCPPQLKENLHLELQRLLIENIAIAKKKQELFLQQQKQRKENCQKIAASKFGASNRPEAVWKQNTYSAMLQYDEYAENWTKEIKVSLEKNPKNPQAIDKAISQILLSNKHPLADLMRQMQTRMIDKVENYQENELELQLHLSNLFQDIQQDLSVIMELLVASYEVLGQKNNQYSTNLSIQKIYFIPLWHRYLSPLLRSSNHTNQLEIQQKMVLLRKSNELVETSENDMANYTEELVKLIQSCSPLEKVDLLVALLRHICDSNGENRVGADDLLPLLTSIITHSGLSELLSETKFMEEFLPSESLLGEEGYCLTSLQTVLGYIVSFNTK